MNLRKFSFEVIAQLTTGFARFADRGITRHSAEIAVAIAIAVAVAVAVGIAIADITHKSIAELIAPRLTPTLFALNHRAYKITSFAIFNLKISACCANGFIHKYSTRDIV